jgi:hypothetical protein
VPINSAPVDQSAFTRVLFVGSEPRTDRDTGEQFTTKDGGLKWTVQAVMSMPSRWDSARTDSEVLSVTVTCADDPAAYVGEGQPVLFDNLTVGVMKPEAGENGRIRGGQLFWQASGVRARVPAGGKS